MGLATLSMSHVWKWFLWIPRARKHIVYHQMYIPRWTTLWYIAIFSIISYKTTNLATLTILGHFGPFWHPQCQFFGNQHQNLFVTIHDGLSKTGNSGIDAEISILGSLVYAIRLHFQILGYKAFLVLTLTSRKKKLWGQKSFFFDNPGIVLFAKVWTTDFRLWRRGFQNRRRANIYIYIYICW